MYYRRANAAMIVYDITRESTFEEAREWVKGEETCSEIRCVQWNKGVGQWGLKVRCSGRKGSKGRCSGRTSFLFSCYFNQCLAI